MAGHAEAMDDLRRILASRESLYSKADAVVDTSGHTVERSIETLRKLFTAG
jgi:XRE family aerobic/anaerobic benzoate catabolism transcriptional regulator